MTTITKTDISNVLGLMMETMDTTPASSVVVVADLEEVRETSVEWTEVAVDNTVAKGEVIAAGTRHVANHIRNNKKNITECKNKCTVKKQLYNGFTIVIQLSIYEKA